MNEADWEKVVGEAWTESEVKEALEWEQRFMPMVHQILEAHPDAFGTAQVARMEALLPEPAMPADDADLALLLALADFAQMTLELLHKTSTDEPRRQSLQAMGLLMKPLIVAYAAGLENEARE